MQRMRAVVLIGVIGISMTGCATLSSVKASKGSGAWRVYVAPANIVWGKVLEAIAGSGLGVAESNPVEGYLLAETGISAFSWGEKIVVFVDKIDDAHTRVEVVSKKVVTTNIFAYNWEQRILSKLDDLLSPHSSAAEMTSTPIP